MGVVRLALAGLLLATFAITVKGQCQIGFSGSYYKQLGEADWIIDATGITAGTERWNCESHRTDGGREIVALRRGSTQERACIELMEPGQNGVLLFRRTQFEPTQAELTQAECTSLMTSSQAYQALIPPNEHQSEGITFPDDFDGKHQLSYQSAPGIFDCANDPQSTASFSGSKATFDSCFQGVPGYSAPYTGTFTAIDYFPAIDNDGYGDYLILRFNDGTPTSSQLFCARYMCTPAECTMSINIEEPDNVKCYTNIGYDTYTLSADRVLQLTRDPCLVNPCQNGGVCSPMGVADHRCSCLAGYTGRNCDIRPDPCLNNPCLNGGTCRPSGTSYSCNCLAPYTGTNCQTQGRTCFLYPNWQQRLHALGTTDVRYNSDQIIYDSGSLSFTCEVLRQSLDNIQPAVMTTRLNNDPTQRACTHNWLYGPVHLRRTIQVIQNTMLTAEDCDGRFTPRDRDTYEVFVARNGPGDTFETVQLPFADSGAQPYSVTINENIGLLDTCPGATATVSSDTLSLNANCFGTSSYVQPFRVDMRAVALLTEEQVSGTTTGVGGGYIVFAFVDPSDGIEKTVCTRYSTMGGIQLSFNVASEEKPECDAMQLPTDYNNEKQAIVLTSDKCSPDPCRNGAMCRNVVNAAGLQDYSCTCTTGFTGPTCQININDCLGVICLNGGTCVDGIGDFTCRCRTGYYGFNCQNFDDCQASTCLNGGTCEDPDHRNPNTAICYCLPAWVGARCEIEANECLSSPCENGGTCTDHLNAFSCQCLGGYSGRYCEIEINECLSMPCLNGGTCFDRVNAYHCSCATGFNGVNCENRFECDHSPCMNGATCVDDFNDYICYCMPGFTDKTCSSLMQLCLSTTCMNGGTCYQDSTSLACNCLPGYYGDRCEFRDMCYSPFPICKNGGTCYDQADPDYFCVCRSGFFGTHCEKTEPKPCENNHCGMHGTCLPIPIDAYICQCDDGFTGSYCETRLDPCRTPVQPCRNGGQCAPISGTNYRCLCVNDYSGTYCEVPPRDPCVDNLCEHGQCMPQDGYYNCRCEPQWSGLYCNQPVDPCSNPSPCMNGAQCLSQGPTDYICICVNGWTGYNCNEMDPCYEQPCQNGGRCVVTRFNRYECSCIEEWTGRLCDVIDVCYHNPCLNDGRCTENGFGSHECFCVGPWTGTTCSVMDPCYERPCLNGGRCRKAPSGGFDCDCTSGWKGRRCEEPEACSSRPCLNNGQCSTMGAGHFRCSCAPGWIGYNCAEREPCYSNPCRNGGRCYSTGPGYFDCACVGLWTGRTCTDPVGPTDLCIPNPCRNGGVCITYETTTKCLCGELFKGARCEQRYSPIEPPKPRGPVLDRTAIILIVVISALVVAILVISCCLFCCRRRDPVIYEDHVSVVSKPYSTSSAGPLVVATAAQPPAAFYPTYVRASSTVPAIQQCVS